MLKKAHRLPNSLLNDFSSFSILAICWLRRVASISVTAPQLQVKYGLVFNQLMGFLVFAPHFWQGMGISVFSIMNIPFLNQLKTNNSRGF